MHFDERDEGEYRIYAGAMETPSGYTAAVAIRHLGSSASAAPVYRDEAMAGGYAWFQARDALQYAIAVAQKWVRRQAVASLATAD